MKLNSKEAYAVKNSDYSKLNIEELTRVFDNAEHEGADLFKMRCDILVEFERRKESHPKMGRGLYAFFREVSSGKLSPKAAFTLGSMPDIIEKITHLSLAQQEFLAAGEPVAIAVANKSTGDINTVEKPITQLSSKEIARAFSDKGIRPVFEQKTIVRREENARKPIVKRSAPQLAIDPSDNVLTLGGLTVSLDDVVRLLRERGFIVKYPAVSKRAA